MKKTSRLVLALAIPSILENLFQVLVGFSDTYFISTIGTDAIVGVSATNLLMNIYIAFYLAVSIGATALLTRYFGAEDKKCVSNVLHQSILMTGILSVSLVVINLLLAKPLMQLLGLEPSVIQKTLPYFITITISTIALALSMNLSSALRAMGDTKTPMHVGLIVNIVNIILNYILIFGIFNFKGIGLLGAGLASAIARFVGLTILYFRFTPINKKMEKAFYIHLNKLHSIDTKLISSIAKISIPAAIEKLIMRSGQVVYGAMIIGISKEVYAAHNIAGTIECFSYLPAMGFGVAASTIIGQNLGKNDIETAKKSGWTAYGLATAFMVFIGLIFFTLAPFLSSLFTEDPLIIDYSTRALRIIACVQPFLASTMVITSALQGAGDTKFPMISTLIGIWSVRVLGIYILGVVMGLGITGVWLAVAFDIIIRGILLLIRFYKGKWQNIKLIKGV